MTTRREFIEKLALGSLGGIIASGVAPAYLKDLKINDSGVPLEEAQQLHEECLIFDIHNDTPVERVARGEDVSTMMHVDRDYHSDWPRMNATGYDAASFIIGNGRIANVWVTLEQTLSMIESNPEKLMTVYSSEDVVRAKKTGKVGILLSIEGIAKWVMGETDILRMLYRNGVRWVSITHGEGGLGPDLNDPRNPLYRNMRTGPLQLQGTPTPSGRLINRQIKQAERRNAIGLTPFGKEILDLSNELGIVTDLGHINDKAYFDVLERTSKPAVVNHPGAFSVCSYSPNLTDDQIKALAANGGVMGISFIRQYLSDEPEKATLQTLMEHIAYVADLVGVEHAGIGSDFDGAPLGSGISLIIEDVAQLDRVTQAMMEFGFSDDEIKKIWGGNILRVLDQNMG